MSWGLGQWGIDNPWGAGNTAAPPTLIDVTVDDPALVSGLVDIEGGTIVGLIGTEFTSDMIIEVITGASSGGFDPVGGSDASSGSSGGVVVGLGYIFNPAFDVTPTSAWVGMPALPAGVYDLRITTAGGSATLEDAIVAAPFAAEFTVASNRGKWAAAWATGDRILGGGG